MRAWPTPDELLELALDQADSAARCDLVLERAFLGGVICSGADVVQRVWFLLAPGEFFDQLHAAIWSSCLRLRAAGSVAIEHVAREVTPMPGARHRLSEIYWGFVAGEDEIDFLLRAAAAIKRAAAGRACARLLRREPRAARRPPPRTDAEAPHWLRRRTS